MKDLDGINRLRTILSRCTAAIFYRPIENEIDLKKLPLSDSFPAAKIISPIDKNADPFVWAEQCKNKFNGLAVCVFVPGTIFDLTGTRHGRGGGWYDRFLSRVPTSWIRIGVAHADDISKTPLIREVWDEPVDWIIVDDWAVYETGTRGQTP